MENTSESSKSPHSNSSEPVKFIGAFASDYNPELLLPVGNLEMAQAAIHNGADAIYIGVPGFNARGRTVDFELSALKALIDQCHLYGVRVNLALNILIFQDELKEVAELLRQIIPLKPDAFIVQDLGLVRLIRAIAPDQPIHASTQMTVTNHEAIHLLNDLNIRRFVLGRENSLKEIKTIKSQTDKDLEVFVHGALCVSYSGQCFTSEAIGGRSANRGQCAQSCRYSYELFVDGERHRKTIDREYLVSPHDLCGIREIPELMDIGVKSFKIEGRLKTPEYVAAAARDYRKAIDKHTEGKTLSSKELNQSLKKMSSTYSRGFFSGWLHGVNHQKLVDGTYSAHRGLKVGVIKEVQAEALLVQLEKDIQLKAGDGLVWAFKRPILRSQKNSKDGHDLVTDLKQQEWSEAGGQIFQIRPLGNQIFELRFANNKKLESLFKGAALYLNSDAELNRELNKSFTQKDFLKKIPVSVSVQFNLGSVVSVKMSDGVFEVEATTTSVAQKAERLAVTDEFITDELASLGGTVFSLAHIQIQRRDVSQALFVGHKELKELRRTLSEKLVIARTNERVDGGKVQVCDSENEWQSICEMIERKALQESSEKTSEPTRLNVLLREKSQVDDLIEAVDSGEVLLNSLGVVIIDFEFGIDIGPSVEKIKAKGLRAGIATTRILKPQEYLNLKVIERLKPDAILVRNLGALRYFTEVSPFSGELMGDFSLNVTNSLTAEYLLSKGLSSLCVSYDLNQKQVNELLQFSNPNKLEVTVHQYMPSFHMEHCVFAAFLSQGTSFKDCGKPCEKHVLELKDQYGNRHQIKPDQECRNTMYNAVSTSAARFVPDWQKQGLGAVRFEALRERKHELSRKIRGYQDLILGSKAASEVVDSLQLVENYGLQDSHFSNDKKHQDRKKDSTNNYGRPSL